MLSDAKDGEIIEATLSVASEETQVVADAREDGCAKGIIGQPGAAYAPGARLGKLDRFGKFESSKFSFKIPPPKYF